MRLLGAIGLFKGIKEDELSAMLKCLGAEFANVKRNTVLLLAGHRPQRVGVVLSGQLHIIKEDYDGNRTLVAALEPGEIFAEALCCAGVEHSPVTVVAETDAKVMQIQFERILHTCPSACGFHTKLIENMLGLIARKNLLLQSRMEMVTLHSVREKVLRYLGSFGKGKTIVVPFNREQMADYLSVERSALSHELAKMKRDGLIEYRKNEFILR